jgi:integrase
MALKKRGKGSTWHLRIRPFGKQVWVSTGTNLKSVAKSIEKQIMVACRSQDYSFLDPLSRKACLQMFRNQRLEVPSSLSGEVVVKPELTLWKGIELCLKHPEVRDSGNRERLEQGFFHLLKHFGEDYSVKEIWIPQVKEYQHKRLARGAAPSTVNKEKAALSKMFQFLVEMRHLEVNPIRLVKNLSEKADARQAYVGFDDFQRILELLPIWFRPIAQTAYYTGMRKGEVVGLTRKSINLSKRMIYLRPEDVKEGEWKRVPIHKNLVPILEEVMKVRAIGKDRIFLHNGEPVTHRDQLRWCWDRKVPKLGFDSPPTFHDLRHTWKTNARRSEMDPEIRESIMGHWFKEKSITERYGRIGDQELLRAIDQMSFDHGPTEILARLRKEKSRGGQPSGREQNVSKVCSLQAINVITI